MRDVDPVNPVAPYVGGKRLLAKTIIRKIEQIPHRLYAEPFIGMGGIFLRRRQAAKVEVINDRSKDVANLFRILQRHYPQFMDTLRFQITTRTDFERLRKVDRATLTDLERAARFLYLQRLTYGGKVRGRMFGVTATSPARFNLRNLEPMLADVHERLAGVVVENLDFKDFITRYDRKFALFYIDPPYWGHEGDYGKELFSRADFEALNGLLRDLKGRFILSINDRPETRAFFDGFTIEEADTRYMSGTGKGNGKRVTELIISG